ncbi:MAG: helix-hairpin-helix domain-containing protein [Promethearchaeota archaeon]
MSKIQTMLEDLSTITKKTAALLKRAGIDTIEKLALKKVEELLEIKGITHSTALAYIIEANDFLNGKEGEALDKITDDNDISEKEISKLKKGSSKKKPDKQIVSKKIVQKKDPIKTDSIKQKPKDDLVIGYIKDLFPEEIVLRIRFLHFKLKKLELSLGEQNEIASYEDLDLVSEYIDLLNINYKVKNQNLVIKELAITTSYYDPVDNKEFTIYDLMFECARVSWVSARLYAKFSKNFEKVEDWENAIISMVKCSRMYKTATYFSTAAVNQDKIGKSLEPKNLEFESEQSRIFAQSLAAIKEERQNNLIFASKLYAGLSLLSRRLLYLGFDDKKIKEQLSAQADFDMGKACYLKAQFLQNLESESSDGQTHTRLIEDLLKKAVYYFSSSEEIWEEMLKKFKNLAEKEKGNILFNLSVVDDNIKEIDAEIFPFEDLKDIKNPEPYIIVPENLAEKLPRTTLYFSNIKPMDINVEIFRKYSKNNLDKPNPKRKKEELLSKKTSLGRTIKELRSLYDNNDVNIDKYTELYEKYTTKLNNIELEIQKLEGSTNQGKKSKK